MAERFSFRLLAALVLCSGLGCAYSWSQTDIRSGSTPPSQDRPSAAPVQDAQKTASPEPVLAANIAPEVEAANLRLRQIRRDLDIACRYSDLEKRLEVLTALLKRIRMELESGNILQEEELFNSRQELARFSLGLKELQNELVPRSRVLEERREELGRMESLWEVASQSLSGQEAPGSSRKLVSSTRQMIDEIILPGDTRKKIIEALEITRNKREKLPRRAKIHTSPPT